MSRPRHGATSLRSRPGISSRATRSGKCSAEPVGTRSPSFTAPVKLPTDLMPGTAALPHGWGRQAATGLSVARRTRGVNANLLATDGPERIERVCGMAHLTGFPVEVRPAAGPQDLGSRSGLPPGKTG